MHIPAGLCALLLTGLTACTQPVCKTGYMYREGRCQRVTAVDDLSDAGTPVDAGKNEPPPNDPDALDGGDDAGGRQHAKDAGHDTGMPTGPLDSGSGDGDGDTHGDGDGDPSCASGYEADGHGGCADIDECAIDNGDCDPETKCTNTDGGRTCGACPSGNGFGDTPCDNFDPCSIDNGGCDPHKACSHHFGTVYCGACATGYADDGHGVCGDIDECESGNGGCNVLRHCVNLTGTRMCEDCPKGYTNKGTTDCSDVDECASNHGGCDPHVSCTNTAGSFSCGDCPKGYITDSPGHCSDVDECATDNGGCDLRSCTNSIGSYQCGTCPENYWDPNGGPCEPMLLGVHVNRAATLEPAFELYERGYQLHWSQDSQDAAISFTVPPGISVSVNGQAYPSDALIPVDTSVAQTLTVELTGAGKGKGIYGFDSRQDCITWPMIPMPRDHWSSSVKPDDVGAGRGEVAIFSGVSEGDWFPATVATASDLTGLSQIGIKPTPDDSGHRSSVDVSATRMVAGFPVPLVTDAGSASGAVLIYSSAPSFTQTLLAPPDFTEFGTSVAVQDTWLAVSGKRATSTGAVIAIYELRSGSYEFDHLLPGSFAEHVILKWVEDRLLVASGPDLLLHGAGATSQPLQNLTSGDATLGNAASMDYNPVAKLGVVGFPDAGALGQVRVLRENQGNWTLDEALAAPPDLQVLGGFGHSVSVSESWLTVSAPGTDKGRFYVYSLRDSGPALCSSQVGGPSFASIVAAAGNHVVVSGSGQLWSLAINNWNAPRLP